MAVHLEVVLVIQTPNLTLVHKQLHDALFSLLLDPSYYHISVRVHFNRNHFIELSERTISERRGVVALCSS